MTWVQPSANEIVLKDHAGAVILRARTYAKTRTTPGVRWRCRYRSQRIDTTNLDELKAWGERMARRWHGAES